MIQAGTMKWFHPSIRWTDVIKPLLIAKLRVQIVLENSVWYRIP